MDKCGENSASRKVVLFANTDWYLYNFRLDLIESLKRQGFDPILISPAGRFALRFKDLGLRWIPVEFSRNGLNPFSEALSFWRLVQIYRSERPVLCHHFTIKCIAYGGIAAALTGVPVRISAIAGFGYVFKSRKLFAYLLRPWVVLLLRLAVGKGRHSAVIVQNPDDAQSVVSLGIAHRSQVRLIRSSGVDTSKFKCVSEEANSPTPSRLTILFAARLLWDKGIESFVEAARQFRCRGYPHHFLVAGTIDEGNPNSVPRWQIDRWSQEGAVEFLGHVEPMHDLFRRTDIMVLPSVYGEGVPRSLVEAASCGIPIVTTDTPGCREVVLHGVNGYLIKAGSLPELISAIEELASNGARRVEMGRQGRKIAVRDFDKNLVIAATAKVYEDLLADTKNGADS